MWKFSAIDRIGTDALALQAHVARAGCALACAYSSSDEFEAAVIRAKLDAGVYGPKRRRRFALYAGVAAAALAAVFLLF
jgi:hypothetical protein